MSEVDLSRDPVSVVAGESPIERNAVAMVLAEIEERYQRQWRNGPDAASSARVVLAIDLALDLGSDGFHGRAQGNDVHISTPNPRGLLYGAAHLLDALQDAPLRISDGEWTQTTRSTYRGTDVGGLYDPESSRARSKFEAQFRFLARHRFNFVTLSPTGWKDAIRYRHVAGIEREPDERSERTGRHTRELISLARDWGLDAFLNLSEIEYPDDLVEKFPELSATPPANADRAYRPPTAGGASTLYDRFGVKPNLCISEPKTWEFVEGKVREITELFPEASGIQMSLNGADSDIFFCDCERCRKLDKTQRAKLMFQHVTRGLEHGDGKKLVFRPYMGAWKNLLEPEVYGPLAGSLPPSVVLRHNATYGDTYIFNSLNPLLGALPDNDQLCDFDPGGEYTGGFFGIQHTISRYMAERVRTYVGRRVRNFTFRCLEYRTDFTDLDWFVGSMLAWNPELDVEEMRDIWARRRFGSEAGPQVLALLDLGFEGMRKTLYADGINFTNWGLFIETIDRTRHIMIDRCAKLADRGIERIAPTPKNIARLLAEKEEAFELAKQGMAATDDLRGKVDPRHMTGLRTSFLLMRELARVYRPELEALLRYFQWEATMSEVDRERLRVPILDAVERTRTAVSEAQANLSAVDARKLCEDLGMNWRAFKSNKGLYSQNRDVTRMDQNIALPYALSLVDDIEQHMQYVPASVFGYY